MEKEIKILNKKKYQSAVMSIDNNSITVRFGSHEITRKGEYYFLILKEIRKELEKEDVFLLINASRIDVYPSALSMQGDKAYIHIKGRPAPLENLVDIFGETNRYDLVATVNEQTEYHKQWVQSLK